MRIKDIVRRPFVVGCERLQYPPVGVSILGDASAYTYGASAHPGRMIGLERLLLWPTEHVLIVDGRQPIRRCGGEIVARAKTATLDKRPDAEFFQAGSGRD